jgi:hypothetical protein
MSLVSLVSDFMTVAAQQQKQLPSLRSTMMLLLVKQEQQHSSKVSCAHRYSSLCHQKWWRVAGPYFVVSFILPEDTTVVLLSVPYSVVVAPTMKMIHHTVIRHA